MMDWTPQQHTVVEKLHPDGGFRAMAGMMAAERLNMQPEVPDHAPAGNARAPAFERDVERFFCLAMSAMSHQSSTACWCGP